MTAAVDDLVATGFQSFFSLAANSTIAVAKSTGQSRSQFRAAAAAVRTKLITNFVSRLPANLLIRIIQPANEGFHDFRMTAAVIVVTEIVQRAATIFGIAGRH